MGLDAPSSWACSCVSFDLDGSIAVTGGEVVLALDGLLHPPVTSDFLAGGSTVIGDVAESVSSNQPPLPVPSVVLAASVGAGGPSFVVMPWSPVTSAPATAAACLGDVDPGDIESPGGGVMEL